MMMTFWMIQFLKILRYINSFEKQAEEEQWLNQDEIYNAIKNVIKFADWIKKLWVWKIPVIWRSSK